jgi:hypothetical protein
MEVDRSTPTGWTRNARGFDEPPNSSPSGKSVLVFFGAIAAVILVAILFLKLTA